MSKERTHRACAFIPGENGKKNKYMTIGDLYKDTKTGYLSLKIDSLPLPNAGWIGWVNFFPIEAAEPYIVTRDKPIGDAETKKPDGSMKTTHELAAGPDDDIPF